ncbi:MAG: DUF928 domain-containing protein [Alphaproteobacteria bacterium]|nr:DUF928 domain-containing protein [Alphaproteobacteria bacterium]
MSICRQKNVRACVLAVGLSLGMAAAQLVSMPSSSLAQSTNEEVDVVFVPPVDGAPAERIGAGTRGSGSPSDRLKLIVPQGGALSSSTSPVLYWWIAAPYKGKLQLSLTRDGTDAPLLDAVEDVSLKAGLNTLSLGDFGVRLQAGDIYRWSISLAGGDLNESAFSYVEFRKTDVASGGNPAKNAKALAGAGIWYDAFALVAANEKLSGARDAMLGQVGIKLTN